MKLHHSLRSAALALALGGWLYTSHAVVSVGEVPLFLNGTVTPNIVMTLDDSGSMTRAYVPDNIGSLDAARFTAATYNAMYYNPKVLYTPPTRTDGVTYSTSYTQAWVNGFDTGRGSVDLSANGYRPISECAPSDTYADCSKLTNRGGSTTSSTTTTYTYTNCRVTFNDRSGNNRDRIDVDYCTFNGSTIDGEDMPDSGNEAPQNADNSTLTVSNASGYNGSYEVRSSDGDDGLLKIELNRNNYFNNDATRTGVTLTWARTITQTVTSAAYYHLYYTDLRTPSRPSGCNDTVGDDDCYVAVPVGGSTDIALDSGTTTASVAAKQQNFANWYSFYRTRALATMSAATNAVTNLSSNQVRLGWQTLNRSSCTSFGTTCTGYDGTNRENRIRPLDATKTGGTISHRTDFYEWIRFFVVSGATPLRGAMERAGQYFTESGRDSPYAENPYVTQGTELSCRRNFHVMMTDGLWNSNANVNYGGDVDSTGKTLPDNTSYSPRYPYRNPNGNAPSGQSYSNSLADIAFKYWSTDLRGNLDNTLLRFFPDASGDATTQYWNPRNNPATWQHMVNFTISFGLTKAMTDPAWGGDTYSGDFPALSSGTKHWPGVVEGASGSSTPDVHVYDLWHAAVNSRGQFFSADDPIGVRNAFQSVFNNILRDTSSASSLAANSTRIDTGGVVYQARFNPEDWRGQLLAYPVTSNGVVQAIARWDAALKMPSAAQRNITTWTGSTGVNFNSCTNLSTAQQSALNRNSANVIDNHCTERLNWLRGDTSKEVRFAGGKYRNRTVTVLGDTINSDPVYVSAEDYGYASAGFTGASSYTAFLATKQNRRPMVYVGANDGMLHGFRADTGDDTQSGRELLAHIPLAAFNKLNRLVEPSYAHTYFVDGSPTVGDAYLGGQWKTVLLGSMGAGGKAIFALDVSNPETFGPNQVMWEFSDAQDSDLGLTFSQPQIARLASGQWVAIFGNGYNSTSDRAYLFVVDLQTGTLIRKIAAGTATANGLSTPVLHDTNNDRIVDVAYAGDLQGNLWKFDLTGASSTNWSVGNGGNPLFTARNASNQVQPITSKPVVHVPTVQPAGGALVFFGTGQYLSSGDTTNQQVQSFYTVWDNNTTGTVARSQLLQQRITAEVDEFGKTLRETSNNTINWSTQRGWYMDLVGPTGTAVGERVVSAALVRYDRVIFVTTLPSADPCVAGGTSWLMEMDYISGARPSEPVFNLNGDSAIDSNDLLASGATGSGLKLTDGISKTPTWLENASRAYKQLSLSSGSIQTVENRKPPSSSGPPAGTVRRIFWQQIQ